MAGYNPATDDSFRREAQRKADAESAFRKIYGPDRSQPSVAPFTFPSIERPASAQAIPAPATPAPAAAPTKAIRWEDTVAPAAAPAVNTRDRVRQAGNMARKYGSVTEFNNANVGSAYSNIPNSYASNNFTVMPSEAFKRSGYNDAAVSGALKAAAARGDWDAVGRHYASQGQTFGGKDYGAGGGADMNQLYRMSMGLDGAGPQSYRKRDRAADLYGKLAGFENVLQKENLSNAGALSRQELMNKGYLDAQNAQNTGAYERENLQQSGLDRRLGQTQGFEGKYKDAEATLNQQKFEALKKQQNRANVLTAYKNLSDLLVAYKSSGDVEGANKVSQYLNALGNIDIFDATDQEQVKGMLNGGLVEGYARGGEVQPVLNPMGNMGMPSSMADLDPVVRQYAQYVSTASQYGLQPVAFPKFIDLLGSARTQLASLPTQGGATGFADGGAIPVAGRQVLGAGGPTSDSIPAVIDGQRPAALSSGEYVFPTEAVQFYGTDKLNKMIQKARGQ